MNDRPCDHCQVGESCLGRIAPDAFSHFCQWAAEGDPRRLRIIAGRSAYGIRPAPNLLRKAANLVEAAVDHLEAGMPLVSDQDRERRLEICRSNQCGLYQRGDRCGHQACGCFLAVKAGWAEQACPIGMWDVALNQH